MRRTSALPKTVTMSTRRQHKDTTTTVTATTQRRNDATTQQRNNEANDRLKMQFQRLPESRKPLNDVDSVKTLILDCDVVSNYPGTRGKL